MISLPDANEWLALAHERHEHHGTASVWFNGLERDSAQYCRVTQMAVLRLVSNRTVMGEDVLTPAAAIDLWARLSSDERVTFRAEPVGTATLWLDFMRRAGVGSRNWTDVILPLSRSGAAWSS